MPVQSGAGIGRLIGNLLGGPAMRQQAERRGRMAAHEEMLTEAKAYGEREQAKRSYGENQGLSQLETALAPLLGPELAKAAQAAAYGKYDLHQATQAGGDLQTQLLQRNARDALLRGDFEGGNASLAAIDGKPLAITNEENGVLINPYDSVSDQVMRMTQVGSSMVNENNANATNSLASAGEHNARTADIRNGGSGNGGGKPLNLDANLISSMFKVPQVDANGRPVTNPMTGEVEMAPDQAGIGALMSYIVQRRQGAPKLSADEITAEYLAKGRTRQADNLRDLEEARAAIATGKITREEAQRRLRAAGLNAAAERL